jgi:hypothetical protein
VASIIASRAIVPRLGAFVARHPNLRVELSVDDRRQDLIQEGIDVAIRFGALQDSSAIARPVGRWPLLVAAAPSYLETHGTPETPEALAEHLFIIAGPVAGKELLFHRDDQQIKVQPKGQVAINGAEVAVSVYVNVKSHRPKFLHEMIDESARSRLGGLPTGKQRMRLDVVQAPVRRGLWGSLTLLQRACGHVRK